MRSSLLSLEPSQVNFCVLINCGGDVVGSDDTYAFASFAVGTDRSLLRRHVGCLFVIWCWKSCKSDARECSAKK